MFNIIIIICCILAGFALGKFVERKVAEKGKFYQDLTSYVALLKDNVSGRQLELTNFNKQFSQNCCKAFCDYITLGELKIRLSKVQKVNLTKFFDNTDCISSQALVEHIEYHGKILKDDAQKVMLDEVAKSTIYAKLGMLLGAMLGILFV